MSSRVLLKQAFCANPTSLKPMRDAFMQAIVRAGVSAEERDRLVLAVDEAAANVIRHAYGGVCDKRILLSLTRVRGRLRIHLRDDAPPVKAECVKPRDLSECRPGGLGINIIQQTMDRWHLRALKSNRGNVLVMEKKTRLHSLNQSQSKSKNNSA